MSAASASATATASIEGESIRTYIGVRRSYSVFYEFDFDEDGEILDHSPYKPDFDPRLPPFSRVEYACVYDDKSLFIEIVNNSTKYKCIETDDDIDSLWRDLLRYDAFECMTAIIDGETKPILELPHLFELYGKEEHSTFLALAAEAHAHRILNLLIRRGVGVGRGANHPGPNDVLPLTEALDSRLIDFGWTPHATLFWLIYNLCECSQRDCLETVRILVQHTSDVEVQQEFMKYARSGSFFQVAVLLTVAWNKVIPDGCEQFSDSLLDEIASIVVKDARSTCFLQSNEWTEKRMQMQFLLAVVKMYDHIGAQLLALVRGKLNWTRYREAVEELLYKAGLPTKVLDDYCADYLYRSLSELLGDKREVYNEAQDAAGKNSSNLVLGQLEGSMPAYIGSDSLVKSIFEGQNMSPSELRKSTSLMECASTWLKGSPGLVVELNRPLENGLFPLHLAAESLSSDITSLFLRHGARLDVQCNSSDHNNLHKFPLDLALSSLRNHPYVTDWNPTKSIFKLVYIFCLPELIEPLKTVELLASDESVSQMVGQRCVQEGKLVELAALLMVSWDKLVRTHDGDDSCVGQSILRELRDLLKCEQLLLVSQNFQKHQEFKLKKGALLISSLLLAFFERTHTVLQYFRFSLMSKKDVPSHGVPLIVSKLLKDMGFTLQSEDFNVDDINCLLRKQEPAWNYQLGDVSKGFKLLMGHKESDFVWNGRLTRTPERGLLGQHPLRTLQNPRVFTSKESETTLACGSHMKNNVPRLSASPVPLWSLRGLGVFSLASKRWIRVI